MGSRTPRQHHHRGQSVRASCDQPRQRTLRGDVDRYQRHARRQRRLRRSRPALRCERHQVRSRVPAQYHDGRRSVCPEDHRARRRALRCGLVRFQRGEWECPCADLQRRRQQVGCGICRQRRDRTHRAHSDDHRARGRALCRGMGRHRRRHRRGPSRPDLQFRRHQVRRRVHRYQHDGRPSARARHHGSRGRPFRRGVVWPSRRHVRQRHPRADVERGRDKMGLRARGQYDDAGHPVPAHDDRACRWALRHCLDRRQPDRRRRFRLCTARAGLQLRWQQVRIRIPRQHNDAQRTVPAMHRNAE